MFATAQDSAREEKCGAGDVPNRCNTFLATLRHPAHIFHARYELHCVSSGAQVARPAFQLRLVDLTVSNTLTNKPISDRRPLTSDTNASGMWVALAARRGRVATVLRLAPLEEAATARTEDPPFGGLWCDQPAIFLWREK